MTAGLMEGWLEKDRLHAVAATPPGQAAILSASGAMLVYALPRTGWLLMAGIIAATLWPEQRRPALTAMAAAILAIGIAPGMLGLDLAMAPEAWRSLVLVAAWVAGLLLWARYQTLLGRRTVLLLHGLVAVGVVLCWLVQGPTASAFCVLAAELLWRSAYWIRWRLRQPARPPVLATMFTVIPFLGAGGVPFGKGPGFFAQHEATSRAALARSQLDGVWLLLLALLWAALDRQIGAVLGPATVPNLVTLLHEPGAVALWQRWAALLVELVRAVLVLAVQGHTVVGVLCLAGFHIPRNTRAPLLAESVLDFWNRYFFYFKELLVDFFFFPTYLAGVGLQQALRLLAATWAAAFVGNLWFHMVLYAPAVARGQPDTYLATIEIRAVYCALLATALSVSVLRAGRRRAGPRPLPVRAVRIAGVWLVFALLHLWSAAPGVGVLADRVAVMWALLP